jgi:hypothetical protein
MFDDTVDSHSLFYRQTVIISVTRANCPSTNPKF